MSRFVAVCCSVPKCVLQCAEVCVAVCCSVLQCGAVCCSAQESDAKVSAWWHKSMT